MNPRSPSRLRFSKKWDKKSFLIQRPLRTCSIETMIAILPETIIQTTGEITKSSWFVRVVYQKRTRQAKFVTLHNWVRVRDLKNPEIATPVTEELKKSRIKQRVRAKLIQITPSSPSFQR